MDFKNLFDYKMAELEEIEESHKDAYIENHATDLVWNLKIISEHFDSAIKNAVIIQQIVNSKKKD